MSQQSAQPQKGSARAALLFFTGIVAFFVFLSVSIPYLKSRGGDLNTFFFAVLAAIVAAILLPVTLNFMLKKVGLKGKRPDQILKGFVGYQSPFDLMGIPSTPEALGMTLLEARASATPARLAQAPFSEEDEEAFDAVESDLEYADLDEEDDDEQDEAPDELVEEGGLRLAERFQSHPLSLVCQNIKIVGIRRKGKSNAFAILFRELSKLLLPLVIFDTEDEYEELARHRHMQRGLLVGASEMAADVPEGIRFRAIDVSTAYNFGQFVLQECLQVVVNLKSWSDNLAAEIMAEMIEGMEDWQQHRPVRQRIPFYLGIDEISKWVPQNQGESRLSKEARTLVQNALFDRVVRRGGKRGFGLVVSGQKLAEIDKRILQGQWMFVFCQTERPDLQECERMGLDPDEVKALLPGESFVFCPQRPHGMYVRWPFSGIELGGKSPDLENLGDHHQKMSRSVTGVLNNLALTPRSPSSSSVQAQVETGPPASEVTPSAEEERIPTVEEVVAAWYTGHDSRRKIMEHFGITYYQADKLCKAAQAKKLIGPHHAPTRR